MNFRNLDQLYRDSPAAYLELIQFMRNEFEFARTTFLKSLGNGDFSTFAQLKHKIFSTLNTLESNELMNLLDDIRADIEEKQSDDFDGKEKKLDHLFRRLLSNLDAKIEELSELKVM